VNAERQNRNVDLEIRNRIRFLHVNSSKQASQVRDGRKKKTNLPLGKAID